MFLRHYCVHLHGPIRNAGLGEYPADTRAARGFNGDVARHAERWRAALRSDDEAAQIGRRAARKMLFALAGIVSIAGRTWTTDRALAVDRCGPRHPRWATEAETLAAWAAGDVAPDAPAVEHALDGVIAEIVDQFSELIGLWDSR